MSNKNQGILDGIKVLDFGRYIAGPFCGALLGDYGAEVIRIERVDGSEDRFVTPVTDNEEGAMFLQLNRSSLAIYASGLSGSTIQPVCTAISFATSATTVPGNC